MYFVVSAKDTDGSLANLYAINSLIDPVWKMSPNELTDTMLKRVIYNDRECFKWVLRRPFNYRKICR